MLLKYFYDEALAHASYMVGCQKARVAVVVDPGRDIEQYITMARRKGLKLIGVAETHIHADYVSGARELAERVEAKLYLSDEGPADWKYAYASDYDSQLLKDGHSFLVGKIKFDVIHTPGHTPESLSFLLTDQGGGADEPMGIFTGDFVFAGSVGRPDLLEEAAGIEGSAKAGASDLFRSIQRFRQLPDYLQLWPAHGAGSACGKGLGAIPSSTVGYEKRFNPALQFDNESKFTDYILAEQMTAPKYFAIMKHVNKKGPLVLGSRDLPAASSPEHLAAALENSTVIDLSHPRDFGEGHVPGSINLPSSMLASWGGWIVDYEKPVSLIVEQEQLPEAIRVLEKIGADRIIHVFNRTELVTAGLAAQAYPSATPSELAAKIEAGKVTLLDVRSDAEWNAGHIAGANHVFLGRLSESINDLPVGKPIVAQCQAGLRSAIAASLLQAAGKEVVNMSGGYMAWESAGLKVVDPNVDSAGCQVSASPTCTS